MLERNSFESFIGLIETYHLLVTFAQKKTVPLAMAETIEDVCSRFCVDIIMMS